MKKIAADAGMPTAQLEEPGEGLAGDDGRAAQRHDDPDGAAERNVTFW